MPVNSLSACLRFLVVLPLVCSCNAASYTSSIEQQLRESKAHRQMMQLSAKENKGKKLSPEENDLQREVVKLVECSPSHRLGSGIFSWRIKSLKKLLSNKVITRLWFENILGNVGSSPKDPRPRLTYIFSFPYNS